MWTQAKAKVGCLVSKKKHFTLLELLVVLTILSLCVGLTGIKIREFYQEQSFLSDTRRVVSELAMAQDLMLILDTDVYVIFSKEKGSGDWSLHLSVDKPLKESWRHLIEREVPLKSIRQIRFEGVSKDPIELEFSLGKMSEGVLELTSSDRAGKKGVDDHFELRLPGFPAPIGQAKTKEKGRIEATAYPEEVYKERYEKDTKATPIPAP